MDPNQNKQPDPFQTPHQPVVSGGGFGAPGKLASLLGKVGASGHTLLFTGIITGAVVIGAGVAFGLHKLTAPEPAKTGTPTTGVAANPEGTKTPATSDNKPTDQKAQTPTNKPADNKPAAGQSGGGSSGGSTGGTSGGGGTSPPTCGSGQIGTYPSCYPAPPAPLLAGKTWKLSWNEEFGGSDYDHSKLTPCFDWNYGDCTSSFNQGREHYDPGQVQVSGGTGKLIAAPHSPAYSDGACQGGSCTYYSGLLSTARPNAGNGSGYLYSFTYGYVEASLKLPATQGFFTAFWMLPTDTSYNYNTEIDILENLGYDNQTMFQTYHYNNRNTSYTPNTGVGNNGACPVSDFSGAFHRFAVDWEPTYVAFYIDGNKCGQYNGNASTIESGPMQIILDLMVDNNWQRSWGEGLVDPSLTRQLEVDYLRVYQQQ